MDNMVSDTPLFLIAHKVRGELAFDVAHQLEIGTDLGWIIPTSGHRAYPFWEVPLSECTDISWQMNVLKSYETLRDHYQIDTPPKAAPKAVTPVRTIEDLL